MQLARSTGFVKTALGTKKKKKKVVTVKELPLVSCKWSAPPKHLKQDSVRQKKKKESVDPPCSHDYVI